MRLEKSRSQPGAGLGLSLVAAVARLHGGSVRLEDNAPGLRAVLVLPRSGPGAMPAPLSVPPGRTSDCVSSLFATELHFPFLLCLSKTLHPYRILAPWIDLFCKVGEKLAR